MRVLLDTNIIIHREASKAHNKDIGILFNWLDKLHIEKCIHPLTVEEIENYKDEEVVNTMKIKICNYNQLKTISQEKKEIEALRQNDKTKNDHIDTSLLNEVFNGRIDFLISEDKGIHRKARNLGISEKIFGIDSFLEKVVAENPELKDYKVLAVNKEYFGNLNLHDEFFSSFIEDYKEFSIWFNKKADNISYVCKTDGIVKAFLYVKVENKEELYSDIEPAFSPKLRLKIGTFKVSSNGYKLGERFLKIIFDNALAYKVEEIYVTIFDKREDQIRLINLLEEWGFVYWGTKTTDNGIEKVYVRAFNRQPIIDNPRKSFPFISDKTTKYIVPIYPKYHTELFPDSILSNESANDFVENEPHRNAIKKVYISRSFNRNLKPGDIVVFYRTGGHYEGVVSTIGVVESIVLNIRDEKHFIELCRKRSVFTDSELKEYWNWTPNNRPFIVNFLYIDSFPTPKVNLKRLRELNILQEAPRGFEPIDNAKFVQLIKETKVDGSYIIN